MRAVFLDYATVSFNGDLDPSALRRALPDLELRGNTPQAAVPATIAGATVVVLNKLRITREAIAAAPALKLIVLAATGTNNVDLEAARERGIGVCNLRDYCTAAVVQHVLGTMLLLTQRLREYDALVRSGAWSRGDQFCLLDFPLRELAGRKLGIVGYGALGKGVARAASLALGMEVWIASRPGGEPRAGRHDLDELLSQVDVLSLHCPLTTLTQGLIGAPQLARMKPDALLINTARGALVDSQALADALRAGRLGGAAIDVLPQEPPVDGNPLLAPDIPHLIVTPHIAWAAREARQRCLDEMAANVEDLARGGHRGRVV
ncbi:MAG: D-2-hydroxyacid dehydrogenase [Steroidobacteraceae bacterium]|nr:D-2-hydroxyacid dehydrogenase [Steroidobacteraceae bacterium]MBP7014468.1 D-2-hydroxyacid dehydrogenase [Steroidobacteraceae bacterium]